MGGILKMLLEEINETIGRSVVARHIAGSRQLRLNFFGQLLSELDSKMHKDYCISIQINI